MTTLGNELIPTAVELLAEFGIDASFSDNDGQGYDVASGQSTGATTPRTIRVTPPGPVERRYDAMLQAGADAVVFTTPADVGSGALPKPGWSATIAGHTFAVVEVLDYHGDERVAVHAIGLRA